MQLLPFDSTNHTSTKVDIQSDAICTMICTAILADFKVVFRKKTIFLCEHNQPPKSAGHPIYGLKIKAAALFESWLFFPCSNLIFTNFAKLRSTELVLSYTVPI